MNERNSRASPWRRAWRAARGLAALLGITALAILSLGFTHVPWRLYRALGDDGGPPLAAAPDWIVVLGGGGIPSESGLIRCYYGAEAAHRYPEARVMVCLPSDGDPEAGSVGRMKRELLLRGVEEARVVMEPRGRNTREQALRAAELIGSDFAQQGVLVVTSVEHMRRAVLSFRRAGFNHISGAAAFNVSADSNMQATESDLGSDGGRAVRGVQGSMKLRYDYWNQMSYLGRAGREGVALLYYRWRGWLL